MTNNTIDSRFGIAGMGVVFLVSSIPILIGAVLIYRSAFYDLPVIIGPLIILIGMVGYTVREGVLINPDEKWYKYYFKVLSIRFGRRKKLDAYEEILCLRYNSKFRFYNEYQGEKEVKGGVRHEIYLASPNHLNMILVKAANSSLDAEEQAHELGQKLEMEWVQYNPGGRRSRIVLGGRKSPNTGTKA